MKKKNSCKFDKVIKENLWVFHKACKYLHQILLIVNKDKVSRLVIKENVGWYGRAKFAGKLFYSV